MNHSCAKVLQSLRNYDMDRITLNTWHFDPNDKMIFLVPECLSSGDGGGGPI